MNGHSEITFFFSFFFFFCKDLLQLRLDLVIFLVREGLIYLYQRYGLTPLSPYFSLFSSLSE